jgi:hypothetical protein
VRGREHFAFGRSAPRPGLDDAGRGNVLCRLDFRDPARRRNEFVTRRLTPALVVAENLYERPWMIPPARNSAWANGKGTAFATTRSLPAIITWEKAAMHHVEFVGGPLDGHRHTFWHKPSRLPAVARLIVSPDVIRVLTGESKKTAGRATSTAVYTFAQNGRLLRYYHLASVAVESEQAHNA